MHPRPTEHISPDELWLVDQDNVDETKVDGGEVAVFDFVFFYLKYSELMETTTTTKTTTTTIIFIVMTTTTTTTTNSWIHCLTSSIIFLPDAIIHGTDPKIGRLGSPGGSYQSLQKFSFEKVFIFGKQQKSCSILS